VRRNKIGYFIGLGIVLALLALAFPAPAQAYDESILLYPNNGAIGDWIDVNIFGFEPAEFVHVYFSGDEADEGNEIGDEVTAYQLIAENYTVGTYPKGIGTFPYLHCFIVPDRLTDGEREEDVHCGKYYLYATYDPDTDIVCRATFTVTGCEIELEPEEGIVGGEVEISGEGMRPNQKLSVEYDEEEVDIISGDAETDSEGQFTCTVVVPESTAGSHTIVVIDETGNKPEAEFNVEPGITLEPSEQAIGGVVAVSGTGFAEDEAITLVIDSLSLDTTPPSLVSDELGSFSCSFVVPFLESGEVRNVGADDSDGIRLANAQLAVLPGIALSPVISEASPGYVGMRLTVRGAGFIAGAEVIVGYSVDGEAVSVATAKADDSGKLSVGFDVPPSTAGSHTVTASDGTTSLSSTFIMESQAPPISRLLMPEIGVEAEAVTYFAWGEVEDPSGVSYTLQVAADANFSDIVLEKEGLLQPGYALGEGEELAPTGATSPYYWRVRVVDGASNEGDWSPAGLFYVGSSWLSSWLLYLAYGLGIVFFLVIVILLVRRFRR
jgi:hypothetical protein